MAPQFASRKAMVGAAVNVEEVLIDNIDLGDRRRQDYGDIGALAAGIKRVGLLEPIIVDRNGRDRFRLVVGGRRLKAVQLLKWRTIPAQLREHLSEAELRDIEFEENENRKDFTERERARRFESSKKLVAQAKRAGEVISGQSPDKPIPRGHQPKYGVAREEVAEALNIDEKTLRKAEQHVETAERFPFMQGAKWRQSHVLAVRERLEELPEPEQAKAVGVLACAKLMDPALAVDLVGKLAKKPESERDEIYKLSQSTEARDRSLALTKTAELPPLPDPRLGLIDAALGSLRHAIKACREGDLWISRFAAIVSELQAIRTGIKGNPGKGGTVQ